MQSAPCWKSQASHAPDHGRVFADPIEERVCSHIQETAIRSLVQRRQTGAGLLCLAQNHFRSGSTHRPASVRCVFFTRPEPVAVERLGSGYARVARSVHS